MAYQSSYDSNHPYARNSFGQRRYDDAAPAPRGVSRTLFAGTLCAAVLFALWSGAATFYLLFRDEVLQTLASRQFETTRASDAQQAALSTELDRLRSTKFVDQDKIERQLSDLQRIQRLIEVRHNALAALAKSVAQKQDITGSLPATAAPARTAPLPEELPAPEAKPRPLSDTILVDPPRTHSAALHSRTAFPRVSAIAPADGKQQRELASLERTLVRLGAEQSDSLNAIEADLDLRAERMKKAIAALGPRVPAAQRAQEPPAGGPFVPYSGATPEDPFMRQVFRIRMAAAEQERLSRRLEGLPVLLPVFGSVEITSGFGPRVDPFLRRLAMHVGVDIRGDSGDPVRVTAPGTVIHAERNKAYGLMVEVDHGNGLSTRYAHLSAIAVKEGAKLAAGAIVGKIGSTGRSTAPHLHYEVRLNGDAVDPRRYLRAGAQLAGFH
jgi:murein DD-endopeptidase MepM/ murein hydrolase activator NlpD